MNHVMLTTKNLFLSDRHLLSLTRDFNNSEEEESVQSHVFFFSYLRPGADLCGSEEFI